MSDKTHNYDKDLLAFNVLKESIKRRKEQFPERNTLIDELTDEQLFSEISENISIGKLKSAK